MEAKFECVVTTHLCDEGPEMRIVVSGSDDLLKLTGGLNYLGCGSGRITGATLLVRYGSHAKGGGFLPVIGSFA
jgi:hypothetical protein